jgi:hypothetical protein
MMYPESIMEISAIEKQIKSYREIVEKGKEAEILLGNILHHQRLSNVTSTYSPDKLKILNSRRR